MKKYITPEMKCACFSKESILTASGKTAENKLREEMTGNKYNVKPENIKTVNWVF